MGINVLVEERAVIEYAIESGLLNESKSDNNVITSTALKEDGQVGIEGASGIDIQAVGCEHVDTELRDVAGSCSSITTSDDGDGVRPSQIDTSIQRSQHTINTIFGSPSESEVELSQTAVLRAFDLSQSDIQTVDSHREAATRLQMLSEASGVESEDIVDGNLSASSLNTRYRHSDVKDINFVPEGENTSDYESYSSDGSAGSGVADDSDDADVGAYGDDIDELSDNDAAEMDEAFTTSLHISSDGID
ncbi:LOW QUALITY PROTEIN: Hypothetical protein PHPALM_11387 [Phytophthora palmivora]|uniref:Uncharacterized protein n=1 Tax=Phytophthora palmivora TaxID=4796 RepID=A0A2P4Y2E8_9STRA|nr:LOW QUALITY PROTEIN: Hypothetical protein PHPALM_11387 [Phytophthora palmivora]